MPEQLLSNPETHRDANVLPTGENLQEIYELEFQAMETPKEYRMARGNEKSDMTIYDMPPMRGYAEETLHQAFLREAPNKAQQDSWWVGMSGTLQELGVDRQLAENLPLNAKHTLDFAVNGQPTGQKFEVFECGEPDTDPGMAKVAIDTLKLIDQFSGGLLSASESPNRVILGNGMHMDTVGGSSEIEGFAVPGLVYINLSGVRLKADKANISEHEMAAVVIVHELLGHGLERAVEGDVGTRFPQYFDYSQDRKAGEHYDDIHESIMAKDPSRADSQPVREYGQRDAAEDLATATEGLVSRVMGWNSINNLPSKTISPDAYRDELIMQLMDQAARLATKYDATPGFVGSEVRYTTEAGDGSIKVEPVRTTQITTLQGEEAVQNEIRRVVDNFRPGKQFIVKQGSLS